MSVGNQPRQYTLAEVREMFIDQCRNIARYWSKLPDKSPSERCDGVAFSILALLDGVHGSLIGFQLIPSPHSDDRQFHQNEGSNWFPSEGDIRENVMMHDNYYR